ncbi:MAG: hypothetical protein APF84_01480 [Gracilibacter sp. BRH_c7a]|nr:MAG: hypothetical protein APF84_01480 [Gracilibacter sp. BRH_c7a]
MIIETIISTVNKDGIVNFAPFGVHIPDAGSRMGKEIELRLYSGSQTLSNLREVAEGVINLTEDVLVFVETALFSKCLPSVPSKHVRPSRMAEANGVYEFVVTSFDDTVQPVRVWGEIIYSQEWGGFRGFCRAQGAVLEALINATRLQFVSPDKIKGAWPSGQEVVDKTGGIKEREAMSKIKDYLILNGIEIR